MSEAKHTPGPWFVANYAANHTIAIYARGVKPDIIPWPGFDNSDRDYREHLANARLIAAAPELLVALKLAQLWLANSVPAANIPGPKPLPIIAAAIAKATEQDQ